MKTIGHILIILLVLIPVGLFLYRIDKKVRPLLKKFRHDLIYITLVGATTLLYTILIGYLIKQLHLDSFIGATIYSVSFLLIFLTGLSAFLTIIWWTIFLVKLLFTDKSKGRTPTNGT